MPHNFDFSKLNYITTLEINPNGWISPLYIEYSVCDAIDNIPVTSYYWRVKGTKHTFVIPVTRLNFISNGDFKKHFEETLEEFRQEYISWRNEGFKYQWMQEYREQYSSFIIT